MVMVTNKVIIVLGAATVCSDSGSGSGHHATTALGLLSTLWHAGASSQVPHACAGRLYH